jgi:hypothetical protein
MKSWNIKWSNVFTGVAGVGLIALGFFVPPLAPIAYPIGTGLVGVAVPQTSRYIDRGIEALGRLKK